MSSLRARSVMSVLFLAGGMSGCSTLNNSFTTSIRSASATSDSVNDATKSLQDLRLSVDSNLANVGITGSVHAIATYSDLSTADVTNAVHWSVSPSSAATVTPSGIVSCSSIGKMTVSARLDGVTRSHEMNCGDPFENVTIINTQQVIRTGSPVQLHGTVTTASGTTTDVTSLGVWSAVSGAMVTPQGMLYCTRSGETSVSFTFQNLTQSTSLTCVAPSWNSPTQYTEQSSEFIGPLAGWLNIRTLYNAVGDGRADDTAAFQKAIDALGSDLQHAVIWVPAGHYCIRNSLQITNKQFFSIIGEDPANTTIEWCGSSGQPMVEIAGSAYFRISRLTFDGRGVATLAEHFTRSPNGVYATYNELSDQHIRGTLAGIYLEVDAETIVQRVFFESLPNYGLAVGDWNTLNIFIDNSLFADCGTGVTNMVGAGQFIVTNSFFLRSTTADMSIGNTGYFTARHNTSVGSKTFFLAGAIGANPAQITLQNNTILDPTSAPVQLGDQGPLMLIDNVIRMQDNTLPTVSAFYDSSVVKSLFSLGNTLTSAVPPSSGQAVPFQGIIYSADDVVVSPETIQNVVMPTGVYTPPNMHRPIVELPSQATGRDLQQAINYALNTGSTNAAFHVTAGTLRVDDTIDFPKGTSFALVGDDSRLSSLVWTSQAAGPVISVEGEDTMIKDLHIDSAGGPKVEGIRLNVVDQPGNYVIVDQALVQGNNDVGVDFDGIEHATTEMFSSYTLGNMTGVNVSGGAFRNGHVATLGTTNFYSGSLQNLPGATSFDVNNRGKFLVQDNWHDDGGAGSRQFVLSGSGTVTEQVGMVAMNSTQPFEIDGFEGDISLIGLTFQGSLLTQPGSAKTNLLTLGMVGNNGKYEPQGNGKMEVTNVLNEYYGSGVGGRQIEDASFPKASRLRHMLAQARAEYATTRLPLEGDAHRIRVERVQIFNMTEAIHLKSAEAPAGLVYTIRNIAGMNAPNGDNYEESCSSSGSLSTSSSQWRLQEAGEGDFLLTDQSGTLALGLAFTSNGEEMVTMSAKRDGYDQRWHVENLGNGAKALWNRASSTRLNWLPGECPRLISGRSTASNDWMITAN